VHHFERSGVSVPILDAGIWPNSLARVPVDEMEPGDSSTIAPAASAISTSEASLTHVGVYMGNGKLILRRPLETIRPRLRFASIG